MRTYIQQYGKERTGTNVLKALLGLNFDEVVLFDNLLGSKHEGYIRVEDWLTANSLTSAEAFDSYLRWDPFDPAQDRQQTILSANSPADSMGRGGCASGWHFANAVCRSIKDPYAFVLSVNRWFHRRAGDELTASAVL